MNKKDIDLTAFNKTPFSEMFVNDKDIEEMAAWADLGMENGCSYIIELKCGTLGYIDIDEDWTVHSSNSYHLRLDEGEDELLPSMIAKFTEFYHVYKYIPKDRWSMPKEIKC